MAKHSPEQIKKWKANRKKWVDALRSGEYEQACRVLFDGDGYCCLGVLCTTIGMKPRQRGGEFWFGTKFDFAPPKAKRAVGLANSDGSYADGGGSGSLTDLNDNCGYDFSRIADFIESEPKGLFLESLD